PFLHSFPTRRSSDLDADDGHFYWQHIVRFYPRSGLESHRQFWSYRWPDVPVQNGYAQQSAQSESCWQQYPESVFVKADESDHSSDRKSTRLNSSHVK